MDTVRVAQIREEFRRRLGGEPLLVRSPGRVNLIGEHTDYNLGLVLPAAVERAVVFAVAPRSDRRCRLLALDLGQEWQADLDTPERSPLGWPNYLLGVVHQLRRAGLALGGFDCLFGGDIPIGAGMSSSAALEGGLAFALNELFHLGLDRLALARLGQRAENEFVGVQCGIMDQFANLFGRRGMLIRLDCRTLEHRYVPFDAPRMRIVLCDTGVRRQLAASEYNVRRAQCDQGVAVVRSRHPGVTSLRDVTPEMLEGCRSELDPLVFRRCAYVLQENARVEAACAALQNQDLARFGRLMVESHIGLRDDYQVSCRELDVLVEAALGVAGTAGARMMGAGFGGCTINLLEERCVEAFRADVTRVYARAVGREPQIHITAGEDGVALCR